MLPLAPVHRPVTFKFVVGEIIAACFGHALIGLEEDRELTGTHPEVLLFGWKAPLEDTST